jgi:hypothetical protein
MDQPMAVATGAELGKEIEGGDGGGLRFFAALLSGLGVAALVAPTAVAKRFGTTWGDLASAMRVLHAAAPAFVAMGVAAFVAASAWARRQPRAATSVMAGLAVLGYVSLTTCLADWMIDDAAITFAYSKNLAAGHGLVINPGHAPEEGYSNTLWMLFLAGSKVLGGDIAATAKWGCVTFGAIAVALCFYVSDALTEGRARFAPLALAMSICVGAPFVIWSASGLEHAMQAAALMAVVAAPSWPRFQRAIMATALSALVLTRPEAPLVVVCVTLVLILRDRTLASVIAEARRQWPVFVIPALSWAGLLAFRLAYFHDPLSNPYYAKSEGSNALRLLNVVGGGWAYVYGWLGEARTWLVVPLLLVAPWRDTPLRYRLAVAVCAAQLGFVLYFQGDWMGCYRFISPVLPALAVVAVVSITQAGERWRRLASNMTLLALVWLLGMGTISQLVVFRTRPTTPTAIVAQIGQTFVDLGHRLGVERPVLAHHDAGGTSYAAGIDLVDFGGLADRVIAKHMNDREFMRRYIFEERRPTFIFGVSTNFAAGRVDLEHMPEFAAQYVRVNFPGKPYMGAQLCHVRRDVIHAAPGIHEAPDGASWIVD